VRIMSHVGRVGDQEEEGSLGRVGGRSFYCTHADRGQTDKSEKEFSISITTASGSSRLSLIVDGQGVEGDGIKLGRTNNHTVTRDWYHQQQHQHPPNWCRLTA
jgi:hypothetical protein